MVKLSSKKKKKQQRREKKEGPPDTHRKRAPTNAPKKEVGLGGETQAQKETSLLKKASKDREIHGTPARGGKGRLTALTKQKKKGGAVVRFWKN